MPARAAKKARTKAKTSTTPVSAASGVKVRVKSEFGREERFGEEEVLGEEVSIF